MLNLLRVETAGLLKSRVFWITVLIYVIAVSSTFLSLSYSNAFADGFSSDLEDFMRDAGVPEDQVRSTIDNLPEELSGVDDTLTELRESDNFIEQFHLSSSGQFAVVLIFGVIFILIGFSNGSIRNTLLCGYSRGQVYLAKFVSVYVAGCVLLAISMIMVGAIGASRYGMQLSGAIVAQACGILLAQCAALLQYVAVLTAFACGIGNGWAVLGIVLTFTLLPGLGLAADELLSPGRNVIFTIVPTIISTAGELPITMYQWLARPYLWTPGMVCAAAAVAVLIGVGSTMWGMRRFARKQF